MSVNATPEHKSKRQVSDKTTSRLIMAECYQDNSIENPLKQEQNSGHFLAKLITDYYFFSFLNRFVKLLSWEPDIPMWCMNSNKRTWDHLTPPGTKGFQIFLASQKITADWHPSVGDRLLVPLLPRLRYILQMHHHQHLEAQVTTKKRKYCVTANYPLMQLRCKSSHNT